MRRVLLTIAAALMATSLLAADTNHRFDALVGLARVKRDAGDLATARRYLEEANKIRTLDGSLVAEYFWILSGIDPAAAMAVGQPLLTRMPMLHDIRDQLISLAI